MADNNFMNDFDPAQSMGFSSFKEKEEEMKKRELPELSKSESLFVRIQSLTFAVFSLASMVTILVFVLLQNRSSMNHFTGENGYGYLGLASMVLFFVALAVFMVLEMLYHMKWVEKKDHQREKGLLGAFFFVCMFFLAMGYSTVWMRSPLLENAGYFKGLGLLLLVFAFVLALVGLVLNFGFIKKRESSVRLFNSVSLLLVFWVPVCNYAVLHDDIFNTPMAMWPVVAGALCSFIAFLFRMGEKKNGGFRTFYQFFLFASFILQATGVFLYQMVLA